MSSESIRESGRRYWNSPRGQEVYHNYVDSGKARENEAKRRATPERKEYMKKYRQTEKAKEIKRESNKKRRESEEHGIKLKAHNALNHAIRDGKIERGDFCEECGDREKIVAHHKDYARPLEVVWLCRTCHEMIHKLGELE